MPKALETVLEIDLKALGHNYRYLRSTLKPKTKFLAVVKAFAYGSDSIPIAQKLVALGVDYFAVAYVKEGIALREGGISIPILVLHPQGVNFQKLIEARLEPSIYSAKLLADFLQIARELEQVNYPIHLKFNTGLNRLGFRENDCDYIAKEVAGRNEIIITSVFSHLAASDDFEEKEFTLKQIKSFQRSAEILEKKLGYAPFRHVLNTSGVFNYAAAQFDMVRCGIGLYGYGNDEKIDSELKPIATLKTIISQIHKIAPQETVGYNRAFVADGYQTIATLPIGHADGIGRHYGNGKAFVYILGKKAPIIGNVCMDMIMIDITSIDCNEGDEVIIFGPVHNAEQFASMANTISYELLTSISQRVKREFLNA